MILDKFIKGRRVKNSPESFSPYEEVKLDESDLNKLSALSANSDIFEKLEKITEYQLAIKVAHWTITKEEFKGALAYWKYLRQYIK